MPAGRTAFLRFCRRCRSCRKLGLYRLFQEYLATIRNYTLTEHTFQELGRKERNVMEVGHFYKGGGKEVGI
jgi:hypothetical protein